MPSQRSIAVVGGGFGGVGAAVMLRQAGYQDVTVFERGERVGGVWNDNTYPGARCDVPSHLYEFSFAPNPYWSHRYAAQDEIQTYMEDVARRFGVADRIHTSTEVTRASWADGRWVVETSRGRHEADVLLTACGQLSTPSTPDIPGRDRFAGPSFHTARWRHDVDLAGRRVAVVGTGCSAIQVVPAIQPHVAHVDVYQRSPGWTIPKLDFAYRERTKRLFARYPWLQRLDRRANFTFHEYGALGLTRHHWLMKPVQAVSRMQINRAISDPELRRKVTPTDKIGCKRIMLTDDWYPALTKPNVDLVTDRVEAVTESGVVAGGRERPADVLIFATGFKSHGFTAPMEVAGEGGRTLEDAWAGAPSAYLGLTVPGFPNLFLVYGPHTNGGTGSVIFTIECGMRHVLNALAALDETGSRRIEVRPEAAAAFEREIEAALPRTVWHSGCRNWYVDENGNDPNQWPYPFSSYRRRTAQLDRAAYSLT